MDGEDPDRQRGGANCIAGDASRGEDPLSWRLPPHGGFYVFGSVAVSAAIAISSPGVLLALRSVCLSDTSSCG